MDEQFPGEIGHAAAGMSIRSRPTAMISIAMSHPIQDGSLSSMRSATIAGNTLRNSSRLGAHALRPSRSLDSVHHTRASGSYATRNQSLRHRKSLPQLSCTMREQHVFPLSKLFRWQDDSLLQSTRRVGLALRRFVAAALRIAHDRIDHRRMRSRNVFFHMMVSISDFSTSLVRTTVPSSPSVKRSTVFSSSVWSSNIVW
jgi:hypothetical protein